jgi:hypothetical protein
MLNNPQDIVSISGEAMPGGAYAYMATRRNGERARLLTSRRRSYKWFHQWRYTTYSGETQIVHYFSTKERTAPVPAWVPGRAERLEPLAIVYLA